MTVFDNNAIVVSYPNQVGDPGRYDLRDQRNYFGQFDGGVRYVFQLALENVIEGDIVTFNEKCNEYRDDHFHELFQDNSMNLKSYHDGKKEFNRRILDIYRYAKTSLKVLGSMPDFSMVMELNSNSRFDTGSFIIQ